ncbi:DUF2796 domain-containing protein [Silvanigrella sp.]|jgi:hypothetical protein|uniref:ZrgA family zinc uptake protein n=1 Tax=Silvanigrella sp. TaxID=2024976 RepID=UPI0037C554FD
MLKNSLRFCLISASLFLLQNTYAHGAHNHGSAKINMGVQQKTATIQMEAPAVSMYGFEHEAKTEKDKQTVSEAVEKLKKNISQIVKLDSALGCTFSPNKIEPFVKDEDGDEDNMKDSKAKNKKLEGEHGDFKAEFNIKCQKELTGSKVTFQFKPFFPNVKQIDAQVLSNSTQSASKITNDKGFLQL